MKSRTAQWFICKVRYEKMQENGIQKKVTESYVIDAVSFTEAEERIIEEMSAYISGEFEVKDISLAPFGEIFFDEKPNADRYYKAKLAFITIDEKSGNEKRQNVTYLVNAENFNAAVKNVSEVIRGTMIACEIVSIAETQIMDVFEYHPKETEKANGKHQVSAHRRQQQVTDYHSPLLLPQDRKSGCHNTTPDALL